MRWAVVAVTLSSCCWDCGEKKPVVTLPPGVVSGVVTLDGRRVAAFDLELCKLGGECVVQHVTDGGFTFSGLEPVANYRVLAHTADHHQGRDTRLETGTLQNSSEPMELELRGGTWVHGRVLQAGKPIAGARVEALPIKLGGCRDCVVQELEHETVTNAEGRYTLDGLDATRGYVLQATAEGLLPNEQPVPGAEAVVEQVLDLELFPARSDGGEVGPSLSTDLRGVVIPEEDVRLLSVGGVDVQPLGRFVAADLIAARPQSMLKLELADGGLTTRAANSR